MGRFWSNFFVGPAGGGPGHVLPHSVPRFLFYGPLLPSRNVKFAVGKLQSIGTPGDFVVASGSSLVLPRAAVDTGGQHSMLRYAGGSAARYAVQGQQREAQERRRDEGTGDVAKEVARAAGGETAGALVIEGRGGWRHAMEKRV
jgi:hypothetical protein